MPTTLDLFHGLAWAMEEAALRRHVAAYQAKVSLDLRAAGPGDFRQAPLTRRGDVAVIPLAGVLMHRPGYIDQLLGATPVEWFVAQVREAAAMRSVGAIVLDIASPGGSVDGIPEAADAVRAVARRKLVVAVANSLMASGAYWIASAATEIVASPSALVGSIGVYITLVSEARALDKLGIDVELVKAGRFKAEGHPALPITDPARQHVQELVDDIYFQFIGDVARGRRVTRTDVRTGFGEGRALPARAALEAGLVDRIATFESVVIGASPTEGPRAHAFETERRAWAGFRRPTFEMERADRAARMAATAGKGRTR